MIANKLKTAGSPLFVAADVKPNLNIDTAFTTDDTLIESFVAAATDYFEQRTGRSLMQATYNLRMDDWYYATDYILQLPIAPLLKVVSVKYYDVNNAEQTLADTLYRVHNYDSPGFIELFGSLPDIYDRPDAVNIEYVSGYGVDGDNAAAQRLAVPARFKQIIQVMVADYYNWRGNDQAMPVYQVSKRIDDLLTEHKVHTSLFFEFNDAETSYSRKL
jgi:uncharacterized phiE125 gp8 family phage protein